MGCFFPQLLVTQIEFKLSSEGAAHCTNEASILLIRVLEDAEISSLTEVSTLSKKLRVRNTTGGVPRVVDGVLLP